MKAIRDLYRLTRLAGAELCVRVNARAVATAQDDLAKALDARDRARADCHDLLHPEHAERARPPIAIAGAADLVLQRQAEQAATRC